MRMDRIDEIVHCAFQRDRGNSLRDHLCDCAANHVNAENLAVFLICNNLYESVHGVFDSGFADCSKRKLTDLDGVSSLTGFGFIQPESGDKDVFVHATALEAAGIYSLNEGDKVTFVVEDDRKGRGKQAGQVQKA